jgi:type 1 glutamine amidotransferase
MEHKRTLSRRKAFMKIGSLGAVCSATSAFSPTGAEARVRKATAFALVGDRWHSFDYIRTAMSRTFVKESGISIDFTSDTSLLTKKTLKKYRLIIMLMDGMVFPDGYASPFHLIPKELKLVSEPPVEGLNEKFEMWIKPEQGKALKEFVMKGGSALFYHNCNYISSANDDFRDVEGALFTGHTKFAPYKLEIVNKNHPITNGIKDFIVTEEQHYLIYDKDPQNVLMRSVSLEGEDFVTKKHGNQGAVCEACWAYDYGKGRVCYMAPGHTIPGLWNPEYVKLQKNAVKWLLKEI